MMPVETRLCPVTPVTVGPFFHFFGYYDKFPWDASGRYLLGLRVAFMDRPPTPQDAVVVGMTDLQNDNRWHALAETTAWYWQQGTMLQWLPPAMGRKIVFNTRVFDTRVKDGRAHKGFGSVVLDLDGEERRELSRPIYALAPDGRSAVTLNFSRVHRTRPGYGYVGVADPWESEPAPAQDGIYHLDLETGQSRLIVSLARIREVEHEDEMDGVVHWFNHLQFNPSGTRFIFLHRWVTIGRHWHTRLFTANADGSDVALLGREHMVSHFDWRDDSHILAWSRYNGESHYHLYTDRTEEVHPLGADVLDCDGHCSYSPDREWILTDTYPDRERSERTLILYHPGTETRINVGRFYSDPEIAGEIRCDLHPRWSRDGKQVCIDSLHQGERQMYIVDVSEIVG
ncbi:MAG: hypothetical protein JXA89_13350 [Anaerolineae bacterium]|nr:hypothetical protein [Anaerolineae bacterium]